MIEISAKKKKLETKLSQYKNRQPGANKNQLKKKKHQLSHYQVNEISENPSTGSSWVLTWKSFNLN